MVVFDEEEAALPGARCLKLAGAMAVIALAVDSGSE